MIFRVETVHCTFHTHPHWCLSVCSRTVLSVVRVYEKRDPQDPGILNSLRREVPTLTLYSSKSGKGAFPTPRRLNPQKPLQET